MSTQYADIATTAVADVQENFKRVYLMAVDAVPDATPLTAQMKRTRKFKGAPDGLYFNAKLETGGKVANVPDGKLLPKASHPKRKQGKVNLTHTYTVVAIGGQAIPLTEDTKNAFVSELEDQFEDGLTRVKNDLERQYNGDGRGILCLIETVAGAPTYGAYKPYGLANPTTAPGTMLLIEGMEVAVINPADGSERGRATIASINTGTDEVTFDGAVAGTQIGDYLVLCNDVSAAGSDQSNNYLAEANGILAVTNAGDVFENIDGTQFRRWNGGRTDGGGASITEKLLAQEEAKAVAKSGKKPTLHYTTRGISIDLQDQLAGLRRFAEAKSLKGGYAGLDINGRTVVEGDWCPKGCWFALNLEEESVGMMDLVKMGYVDLDGAKRHRIEGRHAWRADLYYPHGAIWFSRSAQRVITNLADDMTILR
jgi:hypothetical protein